MIGSLGLAAAVLLIAAGASKLVAPAPAAAMLRRAWPRLPRVRAVPAAVRVGGLAEVAIGLAMLAVGDRVAAVLLGGCYLVFTAVSVRLIRTGKGGSCGCFGRADSPISSAHVVLNLACVGAATVAAIRPRGRLGGLFEDGTLLGVIGAGQVLLLAYLGFLSITAVPALAADRRQVVQTR
jgi:hypothetical protein